MISTEFFIGIDKLPIAVCLLDNTSKYVWDIISETNYKYIRQFEISDEKYPKGGYVLKLLSFKNKNVSFKEHKNVGFACFYYKTTGEIIGIYRADLQNIKKLKFSFAIV